MNRMVIVLILLCAALQYGLEAHATPLEQTRAGTEPADVKCRQDLELVLRTADGSPACLKPGSVAELIKRGWAIHVLPDYTDGGNSEMFAAGGFQVESERISYSQNSTGYLARPAADGQYPAVIMIHEWWGLNENMLDMAEILASHGYTVLAVDLYDGQVATTPEEARRLLGSFGQQYWTENISAASEYVQENHSPEKIGIIGWCFGGGQSLKHSLNGNVDATVIYYGQLVTEKKELAALDAPVLGIFAQLDSGIPPEQAGMFRNALDELGIPNEIHVYEGVKHAFANPSGAQYAPDAAADAWEKTVRFLEASLK